MTARETVRLLLPAGALVAFGLLVYALTYWNEPVDRAAKRLTDVVAALQPGAASGRADAVSPLLARIAARNGYERIWIVDGSGIIEHSSRETERGTQLEGPWGELLDRATTPSLFETIEWGDRLMLFAARRSAVTGRWSAVLEDGTSIGHERWSHLALMAAFGLLVLTLVGFAMQVAVGRRLLHPMTVLAEHADDVSISKAAPTAAIERVAEQGGESLQTIAAALKSLWMDRDMLRRDVNERHALYIASTFLTAEMIMIATFDGRIAEVNRSFCERLGFEPGRILGRPLASLEGVLPAEALRDLGERSAREKRPFERVLFTFSPPGRTPIDVIAAVQAVPFAGEAAFMLVAGERRPDEDAATEEVVKQKESASDDHPAPVGSADPSETEQEDEAAGTEDPKATEPEGGETPMN